MTTNVKKNDGYCMEDANNRYYGGELALKEKTEQLKKSRAIVITKVESTTCIASKFFF
jgi:hypothetical protein